jgi:hypothetical protein
MFGDVKKVHRVSPLPFVSPLHFVSPLPFVSTQPNQFPMKKKQVMRIQQLGIDFFHKTDDDYLSNLKSLVEQLD